MKKALIALSVILILLTAACQGTPATTTAPAGENQPTPASTQAESYPAPTDLQPQSDQSFALPFLAYPVMPFDEGYARGEFMIDQVELHPNPTDPKQTDLIVSGSLPTSCNQPRIVVSEPDANNQINIEIYSVAPSDAICTQALSPWEGVMATLGDLPAGTYNVVVNSQPVGEFSVE